MESANKCFLACAMDVLQKYVERIAKCPCKDRLVLKGKLVNDQKLCIVLLLESPHIFEYSYQRGLNAIVQNGAAKKLFSENNLDRLKDVFSWINISEWDVRLVNVIQFQCSCGTSTQLLGKLIKDRIVQELSSKLSIRKSLILRVERIAKQYSRCYVIDASGDACGNVIEWFGKDNPALSNVIWGPKVTHPTWWFCPTVFKWVKRKVEADMRKKLGIG